MTPHQLACFLSGHKDKLREAYEQLEGPPALRDCCVIFVVPIFTGLCFTWAGKPDEAAVVTRRFLSSFVAEIDDLVEVAKRTPEEPCLGGLRVLLYVIQGDPTGTAHVDGGLFRVYLDGERPS